MDFSIEPISEDSLLLRFGGCIDAAINARVHSAARALRDAAAPGLLDIAPAYATLLLRFQSGAEPLPAAELHRIIAAASGPDPHNSDAARIKQIPVRYGGESGPDLEAVAAHAGLSVETVIARHTAGAYRVAMLGFAPGFPYLLGLDPALHMPRRSDPRTRVPAGSVGIGGAQTGIYPRELPGGWQLIGRTPLDLFDPQRDPPALLAPGDRVRFHDIAAGEWDRLGTAGR